VELAPGTYRVHASASGYLPAVVDARTLAAGADDAVAIALEPGGRPLTGTVSDASGGPVAAARVGAVRIGVDGRARGAIATTLTASDGTYRLTVGEGHTIVSVASADYAPQARAIEVGPEGATADFALVPGGVIEGVVRDAQTKEPLAGAVVEAERDRGGGVTGEGSTRRATSGPDGRFRVGGLRPGAYEVTASAERRRTRETTVVGLGVAEQVTDVELLVGAAPTVSGSVIDENGAPAPGVHVVAFTRGSGGGEATSDAKGAFVMSGLMPGAYTFMARDDAYVPVIGPAVDVADKDVTGVVVRTRRGIAITGRVEPPQRCDVTHEPAEQAAMGAFMFPIAPARTGDDGTFTLSPATAGKARLAATCASGDRGEVVVDVAAGMTEVVIVVKAGASISGKVVDGAGAAVPGMTVMAALDEGTIRETIVNGVVTSGVQALTDARGEYHLVGLPEGTHRVSVLDRGRPARMRGKAPVVKLAATEHKTGIDLTVDLPNGVIEGVVTGPDGKPLADAWVSVHQRLGAMLPEPDDEPSDGEPHGRSVMRIETRDDDETGADRDAAPVLTDAEGRFAIRGLPRAKYEVVAEAQAGALRGRAIDVEPDATVAIRALGVTSLSGTVRGPNGPVALFTVELDGPTSATRSFTGGTFKLARVDPGNYTVRVRSADGSGEAKVTVVADQAATVDIVLAANATVVGRLVDPAGKPLPGVGVLVVPDAGGGHAQVSVEGMPPASAADGSFRVEAKAGPSVIVVLSQPTPTLKKGIALQAGQTFDAGTITVDPKAP
jgi:hypothetical protein